MSDQTLARTLHDVGGAAWFGGSLMGVVGLNGASGAVTDPRDRTHVSSVGWQRWTPWRAVAVTGHLVGGAMLLWGNKGRLAGQKGAMAVNVAKTATMGAAVAADAYAGILGKRIAEHEPVPAVSGLEPAHDTPETVAAQQRKLRIVQWVVPALTGLNVALAARMGEQQRPSNVAAGGLARLIPGR